MSTSVYQARGDELVAWERLVARAASGRGGLLAVGGAAGFGKTTLLDLLGSRASAAGFRPLRTRGRLLDRTTAHSATRQLFESLDGADEARLFAGVASLAEPLLRGGQSTADRFAQQHALFWCLANLASGGPVCVLVDDAHWLDPASAALVAYLAERRQEIPVAVVVAGRPVGFEEDAALALTWARSDHRCTLAALDEDQVGAAIASRGEDLAGDVRSTIAELAAGNPFLVNELTRTLAVDRALSPRIGAGTADVATVVADFVAVRSAELSPQARSLLDAAAVVGDHEPWTAAARVAHLVPEQAGRARRELSDARLALDGEEIRFPHALVSEAVTAAIPAARLAAAHKSAGLDLAAQSRTAEAASHLSRSDPSGDPRVVETLVAQARLERSSGAPESAAALLRRALAEPPAPDAMTDVVLLLGEVLLTSGEVGEAADVLARAVREADDERRITAARTAARALAFAGDPGRGVELLTEVGHSLATDDVAARELRAEVAALGQTTHDLVGVASGLTPYDDDPDDLPHRAAAAMTAYDESIVWSGTAAEKNAAFEAALADAIDQLGGEAPLTGMVLTALVVTGGLGWAAAARGLAQVEAQARRQGSAVGVGIACAVRSRLAFLQGRLREAESDGDLAVELALRANPFVLPLALSCLAMSLVEQGKLTAAEEVLQRHGFATGQPPPTGMGANLLLARLMLRLDQGRLDDAVADLEAIAPFGRGRAPWPSPWTTDAVRVLRATGEHARAEEIARAHCAAAESWGAPLHLAEARLLLASFDREAAPSLLESALEALGDLPARLTRARVLLALGAAHRRSNARSTAKDLLLEALELAANAGAEPLVAAVRDELAAAGLKPRRIARSGVAALTPSELRIVRLAATGLTNPEIAQQLFLSPKTVENHLTNAYPKLGISSRRDLARTDLEETAPEPGAARSTPPGY